MLLHNEHAVCAHNYTYTCDTMLYMQVTCLRRVHLWHSACHKEIYGILLTLCDYVLMWVKVSDVTVVMSI